MAPGAWLLQASSGLINQAFFQYLWWVDVIKLDAVSFSDQKQTSFPLDSAAGRAIKHSHVVETLLDWLSIVVFGCHENEGKNFASHA